MLHTECTSTLPLIDDSLAAKLVDIERGIEKEGLRVSGDRRIAQSAHPAALGSTLTHPSITTDYSEALLEFITPKQSGIDDTVDYLANLHSYTLRHIGDETVWPTSMPCILAGDASIPIAQYGSSNVGRLKHVYRQGLGVRYGRIMQSIAGIHYNFSLPDSFWLEYQQKRVLDDGSMRVQSLQDFKSANYFSLIRNFRRYSWLLHYLFGASPVVDKSFLDNIGDHSLQRYSERTYGLPYATSLRMSDLGYQNTAQEALHVSYNSLDDYVTTLAEAMHQSYADYQRIGVQVEGQYRQLNTNVLQIENEYYSDIRPKRVTHSGEKPIAALRERGVEYIEVRILDINPYLAEGIDAQQIRLLDTFLFYCLMSQCPEQSDTGCDEIRGNQRNIIMRGRDPELTMMRDGKAVPVKEAASELLDAFKGVAALFDKAHDTDEYTAAVEAQKAKVRDCSLTPSGRIMRDIAAGVEFIDLAQHQAELHKHTFVERPLDARFDAELQRLAVASIEQQGQIEQQDTLSFSDYLAQYNNS